MIPREAVTFVGKLWMAERFFIEALAAFGISARSSGVMPPQRVFFDWRGLMPAAHMCIDPASTPDQLRANAQLSACELYHRLPNEEAVNEIKREIGDAPADVPEIARQ